MSEDHFFMVSWGKIERRHDARFYLPRFVQLEEKVRGRTNRRLRDFFLAMAGGATPKAEEKELYYSEDPAAGVPFIRVQNLSTSGELDLRDVKLINAETHDGMLARSQVKEDDLLIKITGVGRMAVSSVPPEGFEGNINQHIVRAKTRSRIESETLAAFLNTDIGEALAARRATGGTRPALDYPALRSIPIIYDEAILPLLEEANARRKDALRKAGALLASIDEYLLAELGITLSPEPESTIEKRMFRTKASDLGGWRFDARVHQYDFNLQSATYPNARLGTICAINPKTVFRGLTDEDEVSFVPMDAISDRLGIIEKPGARVLAENVGYTSFREGDLLWAKITPCMENGKSAVAEGLHRDFGYGSTEYHVLRSPDGSLDMGYLHALLRMKRVRKAAVRFFTGSSGHQRVDADFLRTLELPVPPLEKQKALAAEARERVEQAVNLEKEANAELEKAKQEIEAILLGEAV